MKGRCNLTNVLRNADSCFQRKIGTHAVALHSDANKKNDEFELKVNVKSFYDVQELRQEQADRSVLISCQPKTNENKFIKYLSQLGDINKYFFYESYGTYAVVEFAKKDSITLLHTCTSIPSINHESNLPFKSRLISLKSIGPWEQSNGLSSLCSQTQTSIPIKTLIQRLSGVESIDQQMVMLKNIYQLTDENIRLRYLVCSLLRDIAGAYFPECTIRPFGSTVNGFGKLGCDLDMFLDLDGISGKHIEKPKAGLSLEYQMKRAVSQRAATQSILTVIGECVDQFGPGCVGMQKILNARCPLIRFAHQPSGFQCDLTANNRVAMKSSELLYLYSGMDERVRCLVFTVRCWARTHSVTSSIPGAWITNFSLTVMVLFFLQRRSTPILPTLDHLRDIAGPVDRSVVEGNDCTFVSDISKVQLQVNTETLEKLLQEFFEFYGSFPFDRMSINIRKGKEQNKPEVAPLHIQNPFEPSLNVSKNVNHTQLERFVTLCRESSWLLQQGEASLPSPGSSPAARGLATILQSSASRVPGVKGSRKKKREPASSRIKSLLESLKKDQSIKS